MPLVQVTVQTVLMTVSQNNIVRMPDKLCFYTHNTLFSRYYSPWKLWYGYHDGNSACITATICFHMEIVMEIGDEGLFLWKVEYVT